MALQPVGIDHNIAGVIHVQVLRDGAQTDPNHMFVARINAPAFTHDVTLGNGSSLDFPVHAGAINGNVHLEVDDFRFLPGGATAANATAIACKLVFKIRELVVVTLGSVDITAALR